MNTFKINPTCKTGINSCIDNKGISWVSYHFEEISEITLEDQELLTFFEELEDRTADSTLKQ
jgi:hypothetical protein